MFVLARPAQAATANFDALTAGTSYSAGAVISNGGLSFDVLVGQNSVLVQQVGAAPVNPSFSGRNLLLNTSLNVNLPTGSSQIQFDFVQGNTSAFVINGGYLDYSQIPSNINGVSVTKTLGTSQLAGSITATGTINSFVLLASSLSIDNFNAALLPGLAGDYNKNHIVDAADYVLWRKNISTKSAYITWRTNFGATGTAGISNAASAVPEPATLLSALCALPALALTFHHRRRSK